jgi:hypothetical protein
MINIWKQNFHDLFGGSRSEVSYMRKGTEQESNEVEEMPI